MSEQRGRDLRLDFFRGLALWFIFVDHIPSNVVAWATIRNFGFSDATEIFVFISGYSAMLAYGGSADRSGVAFASLQVLRRAWTLYVAHIVLFLFYAAQIAYVSARFANPMYVEELNVAQLLHEPHVALLEAVLLRFRPANMDVLPLYMVLLLGFPALLWLWVRLRSRLVLLAASLALYALARGLGWNLPTWPGADGWFFNPFAWQLLFVLGALCATLPENSFSRPRWARAWDTLAVLYLAFALWIVASWSIPAVAATVPHGLERWLYPIDKTSLDPLRLAHFGAVAYLTVRLVSPQAVWLRSPFANPVIACGRQSLYVFCLGIYLSFASFLVMVEFDGSIPTQIAVIVVGIALQSALAYMLNWYKAMERSGSRGVAPQTGG
ncbi:MAG TPA: OpgC domain-containing protein [Burkholderiaceae bacterium]|nr:OpgC domain-containing protein [Burkholderiaceae bacterium]